MTKPSLFQPPEHVLNYEQLAEDAGYSWVGDFLTQKELQRQRKNLQIEEKKIRTTLPLKRDFWERLKRDHARIEARREEGLAQILMGCRNQDSPLQLWQQRMRSPIQSWVDPLMPLDEFEKIVKKMPEGGISDSDKERALKKIEQEIKSVENELGKVKENELLNMARAFVSAWRWVQQQINAPVGPYGIDLQKSSSEESNAWRKLGLNELVNPNAVFLPHHGEKYA